MYPYLIVLAVTRTPPFNSLCFFFLFFRLPPSSTLFPYTTLFRSVLQPRRARAVAAARCYDLHVRLRCRHAVFVVGHRIPRDRKSTRLNSSHTVISYAVFCLKKKKKKNSTGMLTITRTQSAHIDST